MSIYLISLAFIAGLKPALSVIKQRNRKKVYVISVTACLFLVLALRGYSVGRDLENYIPRYSYWGKMAWGNLWDTRDGAEFGYVLLNKFLYSISPSPRLLLVFFAAVQMACYGYVIYKESDDPQFSFIIFITLGVFQSFASGLRQSTAASVLMVAYHCIRERDIKRFVLLVVLASFIHKSALIFIPLYFLYGIRLRVRIILGVLIAYLTILFCGGRIINFIISLTGYTRYLMSAYSLSSDGEMGLFVMISALIIVFLLIYIGNYDKEFSFSMSMLLVTEAFIILTFYLGIVARILKYFMMVLTIAVPGLAVRNGSSHNKNIVKVTSCFVFFLYYILILAVSDTGGTFMYEFMWR